jgi:type 1 glutamine amidotransferase
MFTHQFGRGRVFFSPFGHSASGREQPDVQTMILRATEWAAGASN